MAKSRRNGCRCVLTGCAVALLGSTGQASAQQIVVSGVVVDSAARTPVVAALVTLGSNPRVLTDDDGEFRFANVRAGVITLSIEAVGYAPYSETLTIRGDTSLTIVLPLMPVAVDTLQVTSRRVSVEGWIRDPGSGKGVSDAAVAASGGRNERTKRAGYFEFEDVRAELPFDIRILAFGYEPVYITLVPMADTTLNFQMRADTMIERLLAGQVQKLAQRAEGVVGEAYGIDRETLLDQPEGMNLIETISEITLHAPRGMARGPTCFIVDELPSSADYVANMYPEEVHRVEVFSRARMNMIRIYTREFMSDMITSDQRLKRPGFGAPPRGFMGANTPGASFCY